MSITKRAIAVVTGTAAVAIMTTAGPAAAATATTMSTHRGTSGCFSWSCADGNVTTAVYSHNTCSSAHKIHISWSVAADYEQCVAGGAHFNSRAVGGPTAIKDYGRC
ncbi:hypothetical protein [Streptomyces lydicus]|uniref:hypothetical protein n=1 Tax=Streptomyces lydicus TaxID=47763 RepID=UPI001010D7EF|nr:hypothetical protein [Streptomyces lydicus]MCZ1010800.1 hypothetical protein [Streptomyces lydicus]